MDAAGVDRLDGLLLGVEHAGRALVDHHLLRDGAALDDAAVRREVAAQHGDAAVGRVRSFDRADDLGIEILHALKVFGDGFACDGQKIRVEKPLLRQLLHDGPDAAGAV